MIKNERDTTKTRKVFGAFSQSKNEICLNDALYSGPCLGRACCLFYLIFYYVFVWGKLALLLILSRCFCKFLLMTMIEIRHVSCGSKISMILDQKLLFIVLPERCLGWLKSVFTKCYFTASFIETSVDSRYYIYIEKLMRDLYVDDSTNSLDEVHKCLQFTKYWDLTGTWIMTTFFWIHWNITNGKIIVNN